MINQYISVFYFSQPENGISQPRLTVMRCVEEEKPSSISYAQTTLRDKVSE